MNKSRFLTLSFLLALSGFGTAYAQAPALAAGNYKLAIGSKAPCDVTISADGALTASTCETGTTLTKWTATGTGYQLISASGDTYAVLKPHGETLEGVTFADQHKLVLSH
ncbi:MAG TPA: hypothetical protein VHZ78_12940 [Rhizomicrobium sp.]|jgi:hypothetical protein|nr:hypothetical protein [Rhizomicrobium sp.]